MLCVIRLAAVYEAPPPVVSIDLRSICRLIPIDRDSGAIDVVIQGVIRGGLQGAIRGRASRKRSRNPLMRSAAIRRDSRGTPRAGREPAVPGTRSCRL
jgi:hypothetical protein